MGPPVPPAGTINDDGSIATSATGSRSNFTPATMQTDATANALKEISKYQTEVGLAYDEIPPEICVGRKLLLNEWSLVATDVALQQIANATTERIQHKAARHT